MPKSRESVASIQWGPPKIPPRPETPPPMDPLLNFAVFQIAWFVTVFGAADGSPVAGPVAFLGAVFIHLIRTPHGDRVRESAFLASVGVLGTAMDAGLLHLGFTAYPGTAESWGLPIPPPWITALWVGFATLPRFSLAWLGRRPWTWSFVGGALGGPLSFASGVEIGAVGYGEAGALFGSIGLAVQYAIVTPLLLRWAPGVQLRSDPSAAADC